MDLEKIEQNCPLNESKNTLCKLYSTMAAVLLFFCITLISPLYLKNLKEL